MQDRLKLRIYCKSENKMMLFNNPTLIDGDIFEGGLLFKNYDHKIKNVHEVDPKDLILMQSTGLKDKHDNLIFEGDIIKEKWYSRNEKKFRECLYFAECDKEKMAYCFVELENGFKNFFVDMKYIQDDYEIIGNIYENEELLRGTNDNF